MFENALRFLSLADANVRFVLLGSLLIGATGGLLGSFAVLRRRSLVGDALAHAALPGVALAYLLTGSKALPVLLLGATISGVLGVLVIQFVTNFTRIKADSAIGIVLSVFFGIGIVLLTHIQRVGGGNQSGLDKFLFGQAAAMVGDDLVVMTVLTTIIIAAVLFFYKEFKALIFDPGFFSTLGFSARRTDVLLMGLIVLTVMVGLQAVGVVLIAAMLITPAVAARFWSERLGTMVVISTAFGGLSGVVGTFISSLAPRIPTGPVMVLVATFFFFVSALIAPRRGLLSRWRRERHNRHRESRQHFLRAYFELAEKDPVLRSFSTSSLAAELGWKAVRVERLGRKLARQGYTVRGDGGWTLMQQGFDEGLFIVKSHRLWEHYLYYRSILDADHVDRPADEVEHLLTPEIIDRLEHILSEERGIDPQQVVNIHGSLSHYRSGGRE
ncbi:MAG: manganese/zinc/iron transport system permease protein [Candidatus Latescibacterota bacterium]|jgi:manganese/zinc/iron transport system permease protein